MNITYDSYNDIKNKCENYDFYTCDFIYEDNVYSLKNINNMMTMTLEIKNKYTLSTPKIYKMGHYIYGLYIS